MPSYTSFYNIFTRMWSIHGVPVPAAGRHLWTGQTKCCLQKVLQTNLGTSSL